MKIEASQRLVSQMSNQEKITHYSRMLYRVKRKLHRLSPETAPLTTKHYEVWRSRLETRISKLKSRHRY